MVFNLLLESLYFSRVISGSFFTKVLEKKRGSHCFSLRVGATGRMPLT